MWVSIKVIFLTIFIFASSSISSAQQQGDKVVTQDDAISIIPINHATLVIQWKDMVIYVDPSGDMSLFSDVPKPTLILITDIHGDHLDLSTLENLAIKDIKIVVPEAVAIKLPDEYQNVSILNNFEKAKINLIEVEAIPMYNLPENSNSRHTKGRGNGYVLTIASKRVYISGDTADIMEMRQLRDIDVAFVCMNLPYTMDIDAAASAVLAFEPKIVYPYHYRGKNGFSDIEQFKQKVTSENQSIEVRLRDWYGR